MSIFTALKIALISQEMFRDYQVNLGKHCQSKQQPLRGDIFKSFGKRGEPYMGGLSILWGDLITP